MITIVDYGLGNIQALVNIFKHLGIPCSVASCPNELSVASRIILPGVGAFDWAIQRLEDSGLRPILDELVLVQEVPVLGICVGMQMMAISSEEGSLPGLAWIPGHVKLLQASQLYTRACLPHMGWNDISSKVHPLFADILDPRFYFLHSYHFEPLSSEYVLAYSDYLQRFASAVSRGHVMGVQFHPEKSHHWGIQLLKNFAEFSF